MSELRIPSFPWMGRCEKPLMPFSRTKAVMPCCLRSGSVFASTTNVSPTVPWVMNVFVPLRTQPSPRRTAVVFMPAASEPLPGSVSPQAASSPVASGGR